MKYLKNPQTNEIVSGECFGSFFDNWIELTENEILAYELQEAKTSKLEQLQILRKSFQYENLEVGGNVYINTETAQNKFFNRLLSGGFPINWRTANLAWVSLSEQEALEVKNAIIEKETIAYEKESEHYDNINNCATLEELNNYTIEF